MPEQPVVLTPNRSPSPLPRRARKFDTCCAARSVMVTATWRSSRCLRLRRIGRRLAMLVAIVGNCCLYRVLGEDRAVDLDRWQGEFLGDLRIADLRCFVERFALDPLGHERARRDGGAATVGLELRVLDQ